MKSPLLLLSILLFSFYTNNSFSSAAESPEPVLDTAGKMLRAGSVYFIWPISPYGGLQLESLGDKTCPLYILQDSMQEVPGIPVAFTPVNSKKGIVRVSTDLNINFPNTYTICPQSNVWKVDNYEASTGQYFLTTGGVEGNPGPRTIRNWFKIEKFGHGYKLVYCPTVCKYCKVMCKDIGIYVQNGKRRLALSNVPLKIVFKKV